MKSEIIYNQKIFLKIHLHHSFFPQGGDEDQNKILEGAKHLTQYEKLTEKMLEEDQIKLLNEEKKTLEKEIKTKEEKLRKLKMAELYRRKVEVVIISVPIFSSCALKFYYILLVSE